MICQQCNGEGRVTDERTCDQCHGAGYFVDPDDDPPEDDDLAHFWQDLGGSE